MNNTESITPNIARIQHNFPEVAVRTAVPVTRGWDSFVLEVNDELIFRFAMRADVEVRFQKEIHLLPVLEQALSTPIPHFDYVERGDTEHPYSFVGYRRVEGTMLEDENITETQLSTLAPALGNFLSELHRFPTQQAAQLGADDCTPAQWREMYRERYRDIQQRVFPLLDTDLRTHSEQLWESFLETEAHFTFQPVFIHGDLGCEHIFCDPQHGRLTGIIDWGDSMIGDAALDFVGLHWGHGQTFTEKVLENYSGVIDAAFWQRMAFYLSYQPYAELLYGVHTGNEQILAQGKAGLQAMFRQ
ncbi:MAG TPA: aminoglycoside phosphotransferase family protein [Ktedonobacteraceae bacterium]|nr:aminoglycoside phosphotransferase family protein [Ktedonobacteraceae bacterium]